LILITDVAPLTEPIDAEDYMKVLLKRQAAWADEHPPRAGALPHLPTLLEWFIQPGDEDWVRLPE
jgi:hypothetical protein